jgi:hypothetical protein
MRTSVRQARQSSAPVSVMRASFCHARLILHWQLPAKEILHQLLLVQLIASLLDTQLEELDTDQSNMACPRNPHLRNSPSNFMTSNFTTPLHDLDFTQTSRGLTTIPFTIIYKFAIHLQPGWGEEHIGDYIPGIQQQPETMAPSSSLAHARHDDTTIFNNPPYDQIAEEATVLSCLLASFESE